MCDKVKKLIKDLEREKADLARQRAAKVEAWVRAHVDAAKLKEKEKQIDQALNRLNGQA